MVQESPPLRGAVLSLEDVEVNGNFRSHRTSGGNTTMGLHPGIKSLMAVW